MSSYDERIADAVNNTVVLHPPKQMLATFGTTNIHYYLLTEPSYKEFGEGEGETVVREGRVISQRPRVVTPVYLGNIEGFSEHAKNYLEMIVREHGPHAPGIFYGYKNEHMETNIVPNDMRSVVQKLEEEIKKEGSPLTTIIKGVDELWDVSLMKFIFDMTRESLGENALELGRRGLLDIDRSGIPMDARLSIEQLFDLAKKGELSPSDLKTELDRWNLFEEYEDRFFWLFRK
ncbi:MAG: hypothetical protein SVO26_05300 [Chloroflexota bacterium]|nr:hypothetical protein [Chloroflexota bacterium]